jgi:hypothetical protein
VTAVDLAVAADVTFVDVTVAADTVADTAAADATAAVTAADKVGKCGLSFHSCSR